jgi:hypothetical protein
MRPVLVLIASICAGCWARVVTPVPLAADCERSCRAVADHCSDGSAKERQSEPTSCSEDLHTCVARCDDQVSGDPAARAAVDQAERQTTSIIDRTVNGLVPILSGRR